MAQGWRWAVILTDDETETVMNFKSLDVRDTSTTIDATSKLNPDGSVNTGFSDTLGDIGTVFVTLDEIIEDEDVLASVAFFQGGIVYDVNVTVAYDGVALYSFDQFYCDEVSLSGSIPGEARFRLAIRSRGPYEKL